MRKFRRKGDDDEGVGKGGGGGGGREGCVEGREEILKWEARCWPPL
jgi:hypothetical protein